MNRPETKIIDTEEREEKGYKLIKEVTLDCDNCKKSLVNIIKVANSDKVNKFSAVCPICEEKTFVTTVTGEAYGAAAAGFALVNVESDISTKDDKLLIQNVYELVKNG